ncbi:thioredoxin-disulfide reductase [Desulfurococcaceae archaeon MEX13E-LK6-19]|nr:thioredoxin-disulfide reductase [Desulfurococcaceae archaeon MEX13E-LK6-19]
MKFKLTPLRTPIESRESEKYDVVIVGGGPAGLTAALYSARYGLKTVVITKLIGGLVTEATVIDDYIGLPEISGQDLVNKFVAHVRKYNVPIIIDEVANVSKQNDLWCVETRMGRKYCGYAVILAIGSEKRKLGVPGEKELVGRGVSYCATCDGPLFKGKTVAVVGGGNSALISALYLAELASKVYLIHRRSEFRAFPVYVEKAKSNPRIEFLLNSIVTEIIGENKVEAIKIKNTISGEEKILKVDGIFIEIGLQPPTDFFRKIGIEVDENGFAKVKPDMSTNLPGIYVAGDAAGGECKYRFEQIITAAADGAKAADAAFKYITKIKQKQ